MTVKKTNLTYLLFLLPFMVLIVLFELLPLLSIVINSVSPIGTSGFTLDHFTSIFASDYYMMSIRNSLMIAVFSSLIGLVVAVLGAYAIHHATPKVKRFFINLINMTSNFQGIQLAFAFIILLGNAGVLVLIGQQMGVDFLANFDVYSSTGILLTFVYFQIPLATLLMYPSFDAIHQEYKEAAMLLNASQFSFWMRVGIPIVLPSIFGTFSVLFSNALAAYATPYALMGNNYALLPIRISAMFTGDVVQQVELGSALSVILLLLMSVMTVISTNLLKKMRKEG
ncbi:MAG: ABC transporter permease subunit [Carnobacterium sp.]|uniref:ABC transporter permease n=1 Tax=Carnobacterium antarcticum TaxID=2126436 RepID=A0ABW4NIR6_9LACT|nr:ABC transporter permease subunit [Carnobacterium sp. CP1]ALV21499.1 ABC transporter permease protein [Carnobacterium sp. CP1]